MKENRCEHSFVDRKVVCLDLAGPERFVLRKAFDEEEAAGKAEVDTRLRAS